MYLCYITKSFGSNSEWKTLLRVSKTFKTVLRGEKLNGMHGMLLPIAPVIVSHITPLP